MTQIIIKYMISNSNDDSNNNNNNTYEYNINYYNNNMSLTQITLNDAHFCEKTWLKIKNNIERAQ